MIKIEPPYFVHTDGLPGIDFNREIIEPGTNENFPNGAVGIRVDDDFWAVAAIPLSYRETPLREIVGELWPQYAEEALICPDHGTIEQRIYQLKGWAESEKSMNRHLNKMLLEAREQLERAREERKPFGERSSHRRKLQTSYFVRQYEHLCTAMAHVAEPREDLPGVCRKCGLLGTDRIHSKHFLDRHAKGYPSRMEDYVLVSPDLLEKGDGSP